MFSVWFITWAQKIMNTKKRPSSPKQAALSRSNTKHHLQQHAHVTTEMVKGKVNGFPSKRKYISQPPGIADSEQHDGVDASSTTANLVQDTSSTNPVQGVSWWTQCSKSSVPNKCESYPKVYNIYIISLYVCLLLFIQTGIYLIFTIMCTSLIFLYIW